MDSLPLTFLFITLRYHPMEFLVVVVKWIPIGDVCSYNKR